MIVVKLAGGLGNQMFQYAAGRYLSEKHQTILKLDLTFLLDRSPRKDFVYRDYNLDLFQVQENFAIPEETVSFGKYRRVRRILYAIQQKLNPSLPVYVREAPYHFDLRFFRIPAHAYLEGFWQSEKYFKGIEPIIRKEFTFRDDLDDFGREMAARISSVNAVCLNVRRGDFISISVANQHHGVCEIDYFVRAIRIIGEKVSNPHFFIFSDDTEWCHANLRFEHPFTLVDRSNGSCQFPLHPKGAQTGRVVHGSLHPRRPPGS